MRKNYVPSEKLLRKIERKEAKIAILGLGFIGLPTATLFASLGFTVVGIDVNPRIIKEINEGKVRTKEPFLQEMVSILHNEGRLSAVLSPTDILSEVDIIIVCVQTPVDRSGVPELSYLQKGCEQIGNSLKANRLIILQSTIPPGTTCNLLVPLLEKKSGLECGVNFWLTYCPERMAPGSGLNDLKANSRLIGAYDLESANLGKALMRFVTKGSLMVTDIPSAEVSKIAENAFRYINIAFANELSLICGQIGVDANEVIKLANSHPRVNIHQPGCGAGGPCLSKDTNLLLYATKDNSSNAKILPAAIKINKNMPRRIARLAIGSLNIKGKNISDSKIAVLGTAYKGGVNDSRDSPAEGIISELKKCKVTVTVFDPHCDESFGGNKADSVVTAVRDADCIIIATDHPEFFTLNLSEIKKLMKENPIIVDGKRIINPAEAKVEGFEYVAVSFAKLTIAF